MAPLLPRASKGESTRRPMRRAAYERFVDLCDECSERPLSALDVGMSLIANRLTNEVVDCSQRALLISQSEKPASKLSSATMVAPSRNQIQRCAAFNKARLSGGPCCF